MNGDSNLNNKPTDVLSILTEVNKNFGNPYSDLDLELRKRARRLYTSIMDDQNISDVTKFELLRDFEAVRAARPDLMSVNFVTEGKSNSEKFFNTEYAREATGFTILESAAKPHTKQSLTQLEDTYLLAQKGEGKFAGRQESQRKRKLLTDQPGQRQFDLMNRTRTRPASPKFGESASIPTLNI